MCSAVSPRRVHDRHGASLSTARGVPCVRSRLPVPPCSASRPSLWRLWPSTRRLQLLPGPENCPKCQGLARARWLEIVRRKLLDVPYFHVCSRCRRRSRSCVPEPDRGYDICPGARRHCAPSPPIRSIWARRSASWPCSQRGGQNLMHHPHLYCLVPGRGIVPDGKSWVALPVRLSCRQGLVADVSGLFLHYLERGVRRR